MAPRVLGLWFSMVAVPQSCLGGFESPLFPNTVIPGHGTVGVDGKLPPWSELEANVRNH